MAFPYLAGPFTDQLFTQLGLHFTQVKYRNMMIEPNPIVSDEGVQSTGEPTSQLSDAEYVNTWTISFPAGHLETLFTREIERERVRLQTQVTQSLITQGEMDRQMGIFRKNHTVDAALAPFNGFWQLSRDQGSTWIKVRTNGQYVREAIRYVAKFVVPGV